MNYEEFLECMKANFEERGYIASIQQATKTQGRSYLGLYVREEGQTVGITADLREQYRALTRGELKLEEIFSRFYAETQERLEDVPHVTAEMVRIDPEKRIAYQLISMELSADMLPSVPYRQLYETDLAVIARVVVDEIPGGSVVVTHRMLDSQTVSEDDLFGWMMERTAREHPMHVTPMSDLFGGAADGCLPLYIATGAEDNLYGSGCAAYDGVLDKIYAGFQGPYYILPSSIHELLILPANTAISEDELLSIVRSVNDTQVEADEILSYGVYLYDKDTGLVDVRKRKRAAGTAL